MNERKTGEFLTKGADGHTYRVFELVERIPSSNLQSTRAEFTDGLRSYRLADGRAVNCISPTEFEVVTTGVRLTRI